MQPEPISPELVLVDPELAQRERARLTEKARLEAIIDIAALRRAVEIESSPAQDPLPKPGWRDAAEFSRRRLVTAVLMLSLLANGYVVAVVLSDSGQASAQQTPVALPTVALDEDSFSAVPAASVSPSTSMALATPAARSQSPGGPRVAKASVERKLVLGLLSAPAPRLPHRFVDATTGLLKNNVQVVCRRTKVNDFLCSVGLPGRPANERLYVRYRIGRKGHGAFVWQGEKPG